MRNKKKCLVLGAAGFMGIHLCERLLKEGHEVVAIDKFTEQLEVLVKKNQRLKCKQLDFTEENDLQGVLSGMDLVFHLISTTLPKDSISDPVYDIQSNVLGTIKLLEAARVTKPKKIIYFSSGGTVYGRPETIPTPVDHPKRPICSYGIHKNVAEQFLHMYNVLYNLDYAVARISNPFGVGQSVDRGQGVICTLIKKTVSSETFEVWGDGSNIRDYIYVSDVIDAVCLMAFYSGPEKVFNVGTGQGTSLNDVIEEVHKLLNKKVPIKYLLKRPFDISTNILDITLTERVLKWTPKVKFSKGVRLCIESILKSN